VRTVRSPGPTGTELINIQSTCPDGQTCIAGSCETNQIPIESLPPFQAEAVFGGAATPAQGTCFDTVACMSAGAVVEPDPTDCTIAKPAGIDAFNVALRVPRDGICDETEQTCFVPLDASATDGWSATPAGDRVALPRSVCDKLEAGIISAVYASTACATKTAAFPPCGPWSDVQGASSKPSPSADAGVPPPPAVRVLSLRPNATAPQPCCPLMGDGTKLYACTCASKATATLLSLDGARGSTTPLGELAVPEARGNLVFAAAVRDGTVFWVDAVANTIHRAGLAQGSATYAPIPIDGEITEATPLLVDASAMYVLASAVAGAQGSPVQLVKIDRASGAVRAFETGSNFHVYRFAQDSAGIYIARDVDAQGQGGATSRLSQIVRLAKADGALTEISDPVSLTTPDRLHGGFIAVDTDLSGGAGVFAVGEDAPAGGTVPTRVVRLDPATRMMTKLVERNLDADVARLWLLGVVDGAVLLVSTATETGDGGAPVSIRSSSVLVVPAGGGTPRVVADFAGDYPMVGLPALAVDAASVYWLNVSGDLYALPRDALK
jgi:hypothetical protein